MVKGFEIFPNPTTGLITLKGFNQSPEGRMTINVYAYDGKMVAHFDELNSITEDSLIDLRHLSSGVYQIEVVNNSARSLQKLVITR